jgi:polyferredoxin
MKNSRRIVQAGVLAITLVGVFLLGSNAELWCPFGGVEAIYTYATEGNLLCSLGISNFYILAAVIVTVLLLRRAFCGYACPIGAISEWLGVLANRFGVKTFRVLPKWDRVLSLGKYLVLAAILAATWRLGELEFRGYCPAYALLSRHGADITFWAYVVAGGIAVVSLFVTMPFCRWFCPLAAVLNPLSRFGLGRSNVMETPVLVAVAAQHPVRWRFQSIDCRKSPSLAACRA